MEASTALRHVHNSLDTESQWRRAVKALRASTALERTQAWTLFSSDNQKLESPAALIAHSQYKMLFKSALKEALGEEVGTCVTVGNEDMEMLNEYREELQSFRKFLSYYTPYVVDAPSESDTESGTPAEVRPTANLVTYVDMKRLHEMVDRKKTSELKTLNDNIEELKKIVIESIEEIKEKQISSAKLTGEHTEQISELMSLSSNNLEIVKASIDSTQTAFKEIFKMEDVLKLEAKELIKTISGHGERIGSLTQLTTANMELTERRIGTIFGARDEIIKEAKELKETISDHGQKIESHGKRIGSLTQLTMENMEMTERRLSIIFDARAEIIKEAKELNEKISAHGQKIESIGKECKSTGSKVADLLIERETLSASINDLGNSVADRLTTIDEGIKGLQDTKENTTDFQENILKVNTDILDLKGFKNIMESKNHQIDTDLDRTDNRLRRLEEKSGISHVDEEPQIKSVREAARRITPPNTPPRPQSANAASRSPGAAGGSSPSGLTRRNRPTTAAPTSLQPHTPPGRSPGNGT